MRDKPTLEELSDRMQKHLGRALSENERREVGLVWDGYIAGLLEWGLLTADEHEKLSNLLPKIDNNPVMRVFLGFDD